MSVLPGARPLARRDGSPYATYISHPMIGLISFLRAFSWKSHAPNRLPWSVRAMAGIQVDGAVDQIVEPIRAVEERVLAVGVKVYERHPGPDSR